MPASGGGSSPGRNAERSASSNRPQSPRQRPHSPRHRQEGNSTNNTSSRRGSAISAATSSPPRHSGAGESSPSRRDSIPKERGRHRRSSSRGSSSGDEGEHRRRKAGSRGEGSISPAKAAVKSNWISSADLSKPEQKSNSSPHASSPSPAPRSGSSPRLRARNGPMTDPPSPRTERGEPDRGEERVESDQPFRLPGSKAQHDSKEEAGGRGSSRRSGLPRPAVRRASAPRPDPGGQPSAAPGSAKNVWQSFSGLLPASLPAPGPDSGDAERKEPERAASLLSAPALRPRASSAPGEG